MNPPTRRPPKKPRTLPANRARTPSRRPRPQDVLDRRGILPQQVTRRPDLARLLYESVGPMDAQYYAGGTEDGPRSSAGMLKEAASGLARRVLRGPRAPRARDAAQEDAYRMYLGLPQENASWGVSQYRPSRSSDPNAIYYTDENLRGELARWTDLGELYQDVQDEGGSMPLDLNDTGPHGEALSNATVGAGRDDRGPYISVYDRWDLDAPGASAVGKPFEVYDRIYLPQEPPATTRAQRDAQRRDGRLRGATQRTPTPMARDASGWTQGARPASAPRTLLQRAAAGSIPGPVGTSRGRDPYLEQDEGGAVRVMPDLSLPRDATFVRPAPEPAAGKISGILPTAHASPPGGWSEYLGLDLPEEGSFRLSTGRSANVEDRRPGRRIGREDILRARGFVP